MIYAANEKEIVFGIEEDNLQLMEADKPLVCDMRYVSKRPWQILIVYNYPPGMVQRFAELYYKQTNGQLFFVIVSLDSSDFERLRNKKIACIDLPEIKFEDEQIFDKPIYLVYAPNQRELVRLFAPGIGPETVLDEIIKSYKDLM